MNTKIGMSFGIALLMAIGVVSTMLVMGLFSPNKAHAASPTVGSLTASPTNPGAISTIKLPLRLQKQSQVTQEKSGLNSISCTAYRIVSQRLRYLSLRVKPPVVCV